MIQKLFSSLAKLLRPSLFDGSKNVGNHLTLRLRAEIAFAVQSH
jgi:hypothetical protein